MSETARYLEKPTGLKIATNTFLAFWLLLASFPLLWIVFMSVKLPIDSFASNPLQVILGYRTREAAGGLSLIDITAWIVALVAAYQFVARGTGALAARIAASGLPNALGWLAASIVTVALAAVGLVIVLPWLLAGIEAVLRPIPVIGWLATPLIGNTWQHYESVWVDREFYRNFINSLVITAFVVTLSLSVGTLAGYALARTKSSLAFWLLITALVFRALPHSVLVTGYLDPLLQSPQYLAPLWESPVTGWFFRLFSDNPPSLYSTKLAVILVLVSINQPFTIWMLRSFFQNIPEELDEAALVDGCSRFEAFRRVIVPVMWPGVITTGLFSFLLAYNDYLVTALLLSPSDHTMVPAITQYFNRETTTTDQVEAIAAAVSITAPLFLLVMVFQRQIVSGLTAGAVKG